MRDPLVKSLSRRNERLSRATFLSIFLGEIRNMVYALLLTESSPARRLSRPDEGSPRLFEMFATTTTARAEGAEEISLFLSPVTL
jgi:hypothetical protein